MPLFAVLEFAKFIRFILLRCVVPLVAFIVYYIVKFLRICYYEYRYDDVAAEIGKPTYVRTGIFGTIPESCK